MAFSPAPFDELWRNRFAPASAPHVEIDQPTARALCDAGYMPTSEYVRLAAEKGWRAAAAASEPHSMKGFSGVNPAAVLRRACDYLKSDLAALTESVDGDLDVMDGDLAAELRELITDCDCALAALGEVA